MLLNCDQLIIYRNMEGEDILRDMCTLVEVVDGRDSKETKPKFKALAADVVSRLICVGEEHGFHGSLWADYLTNLLVNSENPYSLACEIGGNADGSIDEIMIHDMEIFHELFHINVEGILRAFGLENMSMILDYTPIRSSRVYNMRIRDRICLLAEDLSEAPKASQMKGVLTSFYKQFGVGKLGLHKAFQLDADKDGNMMLVPVIKMSHVTLADLVGYDSAKEKLVENTDAFVARKPANNCLLYGDAGTGKSTSVRALANEYYVSGLRIIQVYRHQFIYLNELIAQIKHRNYRFIIYMDDLSFEDFETEYKYLKAVIEGGLEKRPDNILIYATSNRRHLVRENVSDRDDRDEEMHRSDTMAEKLSLSQRFGVSIYFGFPSKKEYNNIVLTLASRAGIVMPEEEILLEANKWELSHGGRSGRIAQQFIDHLLGMKSTERSF